MATHNVIVKNFAFDPNALEIEKGETVSWKVASGTHTVTADDNAFDSGDMNSSSAAFERTFDSVGEVAYHCSHHGSMKAQVTVKAAATSETVVHNVTVKNFSFSPKPITVKTGSTITVTNDDNTTHTLTANNGAFDTGDVGSGQRGRITVTRVGTFAYHCTIHTFMTGTARVTP